MTDEELARETGAGDAMAFEELVSRYEHRIHAFAANSCRDASDAREITQDVFVRAFRAIDRFDPRQKFRAWLFAIARRRCIDQHRAARPVTEELSDELADTQHPGALAQAREEVENIWRVARRVLTVAQFQVLWLRYAEDLDVADIARVQGKTRTHVKVLLFRARQKLAPQLAAGVGAGKKRLEQQAHPGRQGSLEGAKVLA